MTNFTGIIVYILIWWVTIFAVLPFGHRRDVDGTPIKTNMKRKLIITTCASIVIWLCVFALVESDIISFREMSTDME